jgi:small subunit ribosomal protein S17
LSARSVGVQGVLKPERVCTDASCPYHGHLKVRGMVLVSTVVQKRVPHTVVVQKEYTFFNKKYQRYERRRSRIHAHLPACLDVAEGDLVVIGETRPIAKSVSFVVLGKRFTDNG